MTENSPLPFPIEERYYRYSRYLRDRFGTRVSRIPIDAGFSCPTRDGTLGYDGCIYCNHASFAPAAGEEKLSVAAQIDRWLETRRPGRRYLAYFQSYTNTYKPVEELRRLYRSALQREEIIGLAIGTRPDCVPEDVLDLLAELARETYVSLELGVESVYDKTLDWVQRGHDFATTVDAVRRAKAHNLHVSGHLILGFPTETEREILQSADAINRLGPDALKIHHLHIVQNTRLAERYAEKPFPLFSETEWISLVASFLERLDPAIVIQRLCGDALGDSLIAPQWQLPKPELIRRIRAELQRRGTHQGYRFIPVK